MTHENITEYVHRLYQRRNSSVSIQPAKVKNTNFQPQPNECHDNVRKFCAMYPNHVPVTGWLIFDYPDHINFLAHSVVRAPDGVFADITSTKAKNYKFIESELSFDDYVETLKFTKKGNLTYIKQRA